MTPISNIKTKHEIERDEMSWLSDVVMSEARLLQAQTPRLIPIRKAEWLLPPSGC